MTNLIRQTGPSTRQIGHRPTRPCLRPVTTYRCSTAATWTLSSTSAPATTGRPPARASTASQAQPKTAPAITWTKRLRTRRSSSMISHQHHPPARPLRRAPRRTHLPLSGHQPTSHPPPSQPGAGPSSRPSSTPGTPGAPPRPRPRSPRRRPQSRCRGRAPP